MLTSVIQPVLGSIALLLLCTMIIHIIKIKKLNRKIRELEMLIPAKARILSCGKYEGNLRKLSKRVKDMSDFRAFLSAADLMLPAIPSGAVIIPVPGHEGIATFTRKMCEAIVKRRSDITMMDICVGHHRQSWCAMKKEFKHDGEDFMPDSEFFGFRFTAKPDLGERPVIFIDNVSDTGYTMGYAMGLVEGSSGLVIAMTEKHL